MKASILAKIVVVLCFLSLVLGFFAIDKNESYVGDNKTNKKNIISNTNKIAVIELDGVIASSSENNFFAKEANAANMLRSLKLAKEDSEIQGIILKINSPGGTVAMSQNIYNQIMRIRENKPIIAVMDDVAASGGYYIASAADRIIAQDGTLTGSIGVIFSFMDYHNLLTNKLNVDQVVIKSGKFKDIGSSTRAMLPEEKELMQNIVDDSYQQFLNAIRKGRIQRNSCYEVPKEDLTEENLIRYADGRVFTGIQAKQLGFVDETGDIDTAKIMIEKMTQQKFNNKLKAKLVNYNRKSSFGEYFSGLTEYSLNRNIKFSDIIPTSMVLSRRPLYLWE
ncbi:TPA: signal peptide peptidase SppA [Candidatus Avigastranaerophilus faecigallinarum]|nr:signal peptide peptidase SppA [Candidatus Avigastranaerophilus faecigallinarum]